MSADQGRAADESACTPGSVPGRLAASRWAAIHLGLPLPAGSSGPPAGIGRAALARLRRTAADRRPSRPCSGWGLPCRTGHPVRGGLLHHRFTLTSSEPLAVCSLWHCPAGHPGSLLTTTLPCGARTFLVDGVSPADATAQPTRPSRGEPTRRLSPSRAGTPPAGGRP